MVEIPCPQGSQRVIQKGGGNRLGNDLLHRNVVASLGGQAVHGEDGNAVPEGGKIAVPDGEKYPVPVLTLVAPDKIQGVTALADRQNITIWLSQSYGRGANSALLSYQYSQEETPDLTLDVAGHSIPAYVLDSQRQVGNITAMPMTEGLCLSREGKILVLFESGSSRYSDGKYRTDHVWELTPAATPQGGA